MNKTTIIRKAKDKTNPYVMVNKTLAQNPNLTAKEKGILLYIFSLPDNWSLHINELPKHFADGRDSIYNGIKSLTQKGYIERAIIRNKGRIEKFEYIVHEEPQSQQYPLLTGNPEKVKPSLLNTDTTKYTSDEESAKQQFLQNHLNESRWKEINPQPSNLQ